jgi:serine/threonine protein kinase/tetratricopeptide (TPR) repeat protein
MLTSDDRHRVTELFEACIELTADRRDELYLQGDVPVEIRAEVERLLRNHRSGTESIFRPRSAARELLSEIPPLFTPGDLIGECFAVIDFIQRGGMGEVYRVRNQSGETIALKVIRPLHGLTEETIRRFRREFQSQSRVDHPNVCPVFELLTHQTSDGPVDFFTMRFLEGKSLSATLRERQRLTPAEAKHVASDVLHGLEAAHSRGIVHRDLKPSNIMLVPETDGGCRAVLLDFGLARLTDGIHVETTLTRTGQAFGTLDYMSPEQLEGTRADSRSDLYAFGLIVYLMLTGTHPFWNDASGSSLHPSPLKRGLPRIPAACGFFDREWAEVIAACLEPRSEDRANSASAVIELLDGRARRPMLRVPRRMRRRVAIGAMIATAVGAAIAYWERRKLDFARGVTVLIAGDSTIDPLTAQTVTFQFRKRLSQSDSVTVWNPDNLAAVWNRMGRTGRASPDGRDWREIAFREHVGLVVFLSLTDSVLNVKVQHVQGSPEKPWREWENRFPAQSDDQILTALDAAGKWLRELAGESAAEIANSSGIEAVTTSSWRALKEFSRGEELATQRKLEDALLAYAAALRLDGDFTMAWVRSGDVEMSVGREKEAFIAWKRAVESSERRPLSRREDLKFRSMLATDGADYETAEKLFAEYFHYFPDDWFGVYYQEFPLMMLGRVEEAVAALEHSLNFPDRRGRAHMKLCWAMLYKGDMQRAREHAEELKRMNLATLAAWAYAAIYYVEDNADAALDALSMAAKDAQLVSTTMHEVYKCNVLADAGRVEEAIRRAFDSANDDLREGRPTERAVKIIGAAALLAQVGDRAECISRLSAVDAATLGPQRAAEIVMLLARNGAIDQAKQISKTQAIELPYPRFQIARLRSNGELALATGKAQLCREQMSRAASLDTRAYGKYYFAYALEHGGNRQAARTEYQAHLRSKPYQVHSLTPEPAGSWRRSLEAIRRLT